MPFTPITLTSIHGKRVGLNSTGALVLDHNGTKVRAVTETTAGVQSGITSQSAVAASAGSTFTNYGFQSLSSASATALTAHEIAAPVAGIEKEILIDTSASEITFGSPTTAIIFKPAKSGAGSSMFFSAANLAGTTIKLRGVSDAQWAVIGSTTALTIG